MATLEENKINYLVIDKRNNFDVDEKQDFKNLNKYEETYLKAKEYVNYKIRIENINKDLIELMNIKDFRKLLGEIENLINERREV